MSRIVSLKSSNFKVLKAVEITPDPEGNLVIIAGKNGQGKSSVLDSISAALGGVDNKSTPEPIRHGEKKAQIILKTDEIVVERSFTASGSTLKVMTPSGATFSSGQKRLDELLGKLSLDPLAFTQQDAKKQLATLLELVDLPFEPAQLDADRKNAYDARTSINRVVKDLDVRLGQYDPDLFDGVPDEEINLRDALAEYRAAEEARASVLEARRLYQNVFDQKTDLERRLAEAVEAEGIRARGILAAKENDVSDEELAALAKKIDGVQETNELIRDKQVFSSLTRDRKEAHDLFTTYTARIEKVDKEKGDGLAAAQFPIEGLGFDDSGVTYQGIPFKQASSAEQLRVSLAMAMAMNPTLRVIRIADGSLLDADNLALIAQMAQDQDFQVWIEMVDDSGETGIVIEDGSVKA